MQDNTAVVRLVCGVLYTCSCKINTVTMSIFYHWLLKLTILRCRQCLTEGKAMRWGNCCLQELPKILVTFVEAAWYIHTVCHCNNRNVRLTFESNFCNYLSPKLLIIVIVVCYLNHWMHLGYVFGWACLHWFGKAYNTPLESLLDLCSRVGRVEKRKKLERKGRQAQTQKVSLSSQIRYLDRIISFSSAVQVELTL